jgi:hypothetical protein
MTTAGGQSGPRRAPGRPQGSKPQGSKPQGSKPQEPKPQEPKPQEPKPQEPKRPESKRPASADRAAAARIPMGERSLLATVLGVPPVAAVGLAAGLTALGVFIDILRIGTLGAVFTVLYFAGCVLAVCWVRRRHLFGPMVQPPLLLAVAVPAVVLLAAPPRPGTGIAERLLVIGAPLVNAFPTMAFTTAAVLAVGVARRVLQRTDPADGAPSRAGLSARRGSGAARGATRTSGSPPRS